MAFKPLYGILGTEDCDTSGDYLYTGDFLLIDGTVRLNPTIVYNEINEWGFYDIDWDYAVDFTLSTDLATAEWFTGDTYPTYLQEINYKDWGLGGGSVNWPVGYVSVIGREQVRDNFPSGTWDQSGEEHSIVCSALTGGEGWEDVDNAEGWNAEITFFIPVNTDINWYFLHGGHPNLGIYAAQGGSWALDFDDGTKRGRIWLDPWSAIFAPDAFDKSLYELDVTATGDAHPLYPLTTYSDWILSPRTIRITVKEDEAWITCNSGINGNAISGTISPTATGVFTTPNGDVYMGYYNPYIGYTSVSNLLTPNVSPLGYSQLGNLPTAPSSPGAPTPTAMQGGGAGMYRVVPPAVVTSGPGIYRVVPPNVVATPIGSYPYLGPTNPFPPNMRTPPNYNPPSQAEPTFGPEFKHQIHLPVANLGASSGTKSIGFYHSVEGERFEGKGNPASVLMIDTFNIKTGSTYHEGYSSIIFTGENTSYTPAFQPVIPVSEWGTARFLSIIPAASGTLEITAQWDDAGTWTDFGSALSITGEQESIDLSGIATNSDLTDKVRFKMEHTAVSPSGEPPRLDQIKVDFLQVTGEFDIVPNFGGSTGEYTVQLNWQDTPGSFAADQPVYFGTTLIDSGDVLNVDVNTKIITVPALAAGRYPVHVVGSDYWSVRPFTVIDSYSLGEEVGTDFNTGELELVFGNTRSPFRVHNAPPDHSVKLALMGSTPMDINVHMSLVNLSDQEPANLTGYGITDDHLYNGTTGDFDFDDAVDTEDVMISNRAAMWHSLDAPAPLFYKYLIGRDRFYVHVPSATGESDLEAIRSAISVSEEGGVSTSFQWDISARDVDYNDDALPSNIYSVVLYTSHISQNTMWVSYRGADRLSEYKESGTRREIINPVPLFDNKTGRMNFQVTPTAYGSYNVSVEI